MIRRVLGGSKSIAGPLGSYGAAGNGLLNALIAFWPGDEVSGNALDAHTNALHLTDTNTVTSNPGLVYALARQYTAANSEYHTRPGDDALLSTGDVDFTLALWAYFDTTESRSLASKWSANEYAVQTSATKKPIFYVYPPGGPATPVTSSVTVAAGAWYLVIVWHDSVANTINIYVNGTVDSLPHATGVQDSTGPFRIGFGAGAYMNGRIQGTAFWKSAGGAGGVLTAAQRTALYNGGAGLPYTSFTT
jgi:hypothetical protein